MKTKTKKPKYSEDYIKGFKHGVKWFYVIAKAEVNKFDGQIGQGEIASLEISFDNLLVDSKEAVKSLRKGR